ncbi:MAG: heme exporter protein CcmB [Anaerolineae bacterium]|nr:heme exporter protein CcmB [Anaerolineae bacterium]
MHQRTPFWKATLTIAAKDLRTELRSRQLLTAMGVFALLTTMVFYYTLESRPDVRAAALPGILWVTVVFAGTQGVGRNLAQEHDRGTLDGLLLAPVNRAVFFYGKLVVVWLFSFVVASIASLALNFVFNTNLLRLDWWLILLLGTLGFAAIGTFLGSMAIYARGRETTLPILILPIALPLIAAAVNASSAVLANRELGEWWNWLGLLAAIDVIFLSLPAVLFDFIVEE